jgi:putative ABC transport system permease protein
MEIREGILLALSQVYHEKLKSAFTLLGVIIGVMFLIVVVSVVEGIDRYVTEDLAQQIFGVNTITVTRAGAVQIETSPAARRAQERRRFLSPADAQVIREALTVPSRVGYESGRAGDVRTWDGKAVGNSQISAVTPEMLDIRKLVIASGRPFSAEEGNMGMAVAVLGSGLAEALFPDSDPLEQRIRVRGFPFRVVGVLESQGSLFGLTRDNMVLVPARSPVMRSLTNPRAISQIFIQTLNPDDIPMALEEAEGALRVSRRLGPEQANDFNIETQAQSLAFWDRISTVLFVALPGLVGISLVVGGIVIMNIMLVSVMQRTREVGVRRAIGARKRDIITQFLAESATLSGIGAIIGVSIGLFLTYLVRTLTPLPVAVAAHWVVFGIALGMGTGIAAGVYPAIRAARMDPVVALRHE